MLARLVLAPTDQVSVRQPAGLFHASFRQSLTVLPLRFSNLHLDQVGTESLIPLSALRARHA